MSTPTRPAFPASCGSPAAHPLGGHRAWAVWGLAALVYLTAFFHRTSLSVAALDTQHRFRVGATALSTFTLVQLGVYLVMQIPTGIMADRFGPRRMLTAGLVCMAAGELVFAFTTTLPVALAARALVGLGDAFTFLNVIRLAASWFPRSRYALMAALTAVVGGIGQLLSTGPLEALLRAFGWTPSFAAAGVVTGALGVLTWLWVRDHPAAATGPTRSPARRARRPVLADLRASLVQRGTWTGVLTHFTLMSPFLVLSALWGFPYLVEGQGMAPDTAGALLTTAAAAPMLTSPVVGVLAGRRPRTRGPLVAVAAGVLLLTWLLIVAWPGGVLPVPLLAVAFVVIAGISAISLLGFDLARDANPPERSGSASGVVNIGGYTAALTGILGTGVLLDVQGAHTPPPTRRRCRPSPCSSCSAAGCSSGCFSAERAEPPRNAPPAPPRTASPGSDTGAVPRHACPAGARLRLPRADRPAPDTATSRRSRPMPASAPPRCRHPAGRSRRPGTRRPGSRAPLRRGAIRPRHGRRI